MSTKSMTERIGAAADALTEGGSSEQASGESKGSEEAAGEAQSQQGEPSTGTPGDGTPKPGAQAPGPDGSPPGEVKGPQDPKLNQRWAALRRNEEALRQQTLKQQREFDARAEQVREEERNRVLADLKKDPRKVLGDEYQDWYARVTEREIQGWKPGLEDVMSEVQELREVVNKPPEPAPQQQVGLTDDQQSVVIDRVRTSAMEGKAVIPNERTGALEFHDFKSVERWSALGDLHPVDAGRIVADLTGRVFANDPTGSVPMPKILDKANEVAQSMLSYYRGSQPSAGNGKAGEEPRAPVKSPESTATSITPHDDAAPSPGSPKPKRKRSRRARVAAAAKAMEDK